MFSHCSVAEDQEQQRTRAVETRHGGECDHNKCSMSTTSCRGGGEFFSPSGQMLGVIIQVMEYPQSLYWNNIFP